MTYQAPVREHRFLLEEVLDIAAYAELPGFKDAPAELIGQVLEEAARYCQEVLAALNAVGDREGCKYAQGDASVATPTGFKAA